MKKLLFFLLAIATIGCKQPKETREIPGAYNMLLQSLNDGQKDSILVGAKQLKIYTSDHMMYASYRADSSSSFGIATYTAEPEGVKEVIIYSAANSTDNTSHPTYDLKIETTPNGYKQAIEGLESDGRKYTVKEDYETVSSARTSPMDGAWKLTKRFAVTGKDTVMSDIIQYKTYWAGHVVWGVSYMDSVKTKHTGIGYGSFEMNGENKTREVVEVTTFYTIRGSTFDIDIAFNGADQFTQIITGADGTKNVEMYERLKKN